MTKDFDKQLRMFPTPEIRAQAEAFFEKYWFNTDEYKEKWLSIQNSIFDHQAKHLPDLMFNDNYELLPLEGGNIFTSKEDFSTLQRCMREVGDNSFAVVENERVVIKFYDPEGGWGVTPFLRFKFPSEVSWEELMSGDPISVLLFQVQGAIKDYFVFGDGGNWGRYVANDYANPTAAPLFSTPLNIMGFKKEYSEVFRKNYEHLIKPEIISDWLPDTYKVRLKHEAHKS
jgi:hypothetical protein